MKKQMHRLSALGLSGVLVLGACSSQTAGDAGAELIEGQLAEQLDLGELSEASCTEPESEEVGQEFTCSASTESGETVEFDGVMTAEDSIDVSASNLILPEDYEKITTDAAEVFADNFDMDPSDVTVDCPDETTIVGDDGQVVCEITDGTVGETYQLITDLGSFVIGEGFPDASYEVGDRIS